MFATVRCGESVDALPPRWWLAHFDATGEFWCIRRIRQVGHYRAAHLTCDQKFVVNFIDLDLLATAEEAPSWRLAHDQSRQQHK